MSGGVDAESFLFIHKVAKLELGAPGNAMSRHYPDL
jgi:hypothetical protein